MRTILTLDDDVSVQLERLRRAQGTSLKDLVNEALRRGLRERQQHRKTGGPSVSERFPSDLSSSISITSPKPSLTPKAKVNVILTARRWDVCKRLTANF